VDCVSYLSKLITLLFIWLSKCSYINGSPQNTNVPGVVDLAKRHGVFIGGDDFKSGQTKIKSVLVDFLVSAGLKVCSFHFPCNFLCYFYLLWYYTLVYYFFQFVTCLHTFCLSSPGCTIINLLCTLLFAFAELGEGCIGWFQLADEGILIYIDYYMLRAWYCFYSRVFNTIVQTSESSSEWAIWY